MILIAESGSTKTDWCVINGQEVSAYTLSGINPFHVSEKQIKEMLVQSELIAYKSKIDKIYFYGAGLATMDAKKLIAEILNEVFPNAQKIQVNDDLIAAAHALFGNKKGIACILGTGSNTGLVEDGVLLEKIPALGYILGDEGSGAHLGAGFVNAYLKRDFSKHLFDKLAFEPELSMEYVLDKVYKQALPNKYLASLTMLIKKYVDEPEIQEFVKSCFQVFVDKNIKKYNDYKKLPIGFVGSIAYHFKPFLLEVLKNNELQLSKIVQSPINELINYYITLEKY